MRPQPTPPVPRWWPAPPAASPPPLPSRQVREKDEFTDTPTSPAAAAPVFIGGGHGRSDYSGCRRAMDGSSAPSGLTAATTSTVGGRERELTSRTAPPPEPQPVPSSSAAVEASATEAIADVAEAGPSALSGSAAATAATNGGHG